MLKRMLQTNAVLSAFILSMVLHPDVFKKAQAEIYQVVGSDRLLDFDDRESLPYLNCIVKEVLRYLCSVHMVLRYG